MREPPDELAVLDVHGPVETEEVLGPRDIRRSSPSARNEPRGVGWNDEEDDERDDRDGEKQNTGPKCAANEIPDHDPLPDLANASIATTAWP
jgi:hypothetical protein